MPKEPYVYKDWLDDFRREVEEQIEKLRRSPVKAAPRPPDRAVEAREALRDWWRSEFEDPVGPDDSLRALDTNKELELSRQEVAQLKREVEALKAGDDGHFPTMQAKIEELTADNARLKEHVRVLSQESHTLKATKETLLEQLDQLRLKTAGVRGEYEAKLKIIGEQVDAIEDRGGALARELARERDRRLAVEKELDAARRRNAESDAVRSELGALRAEVQAKLETAAEFLEMKIRSVQDQSKGQGHQLRELIEALRRLREAQ